MNILSCTLLYRTSSSCVCRDNERAWDALPQSPLDQWESASHPGLAYRLRPSSPCRQTCSQTPWHQHGQTGGVMSELDTFPVINDDCNECVSHLYLTGGVVSTAVTWHLPAPLTISLSQLSIWCTKKRNRHAIGWESLLVILYSKRPDKWTETWKCMYVNK